MFDKNVKVEYLAPQRWRHLGEVIERVNPRRRVLYALEKDGRAETAWAEDGSCVALSPFWTRDGGLDDMALFTRFPAYDELQLWPAEQVEPWYRAMNLTCAPDTDIGQYLLTLGASKPCRRYLRNGSPAGIERWMELLCPPGKECVRAYLVMREGELYFDVLLHWRESRIATLSTLDRYALPDGGDCSPNLIRDMIEREFGVPAQVKRMDWTQLR